MHMTSSEELKAECAHCARCCALTKDAVQDATRKQIGVGDIVDIAAGRAKGKSGTVKFIHRQGLFLHVRWPSCHIHRDMVWAVKP